jgi:uncharacterized protein (DUF983 family)
MEGDDENERPPLVSSWSTVYVWVLVSLVASIAALRLLSGFGT